MTPDVEQWVIGALLMAEGAVLRSNAQALLTQADLPPEAFTDLRAKHVWQVIVKLASQGRPVSVETVFGFGRGSKLFAEKDLAWLREWADNALTIDRPKFGDLADGLRKTARQKMLTTALEQHLETLRTQQDPDVLAIADALAEIAAATRTSTANEESTGDLDMAAVDDDWTRAEQGAPIGIVPTGIPALDESLRGFVPNLNVLIGPPSGGKSATAASMIERQLLGGWRVGFFGLEDGSKWIPRRLIARDLGWPLVDVGRRERDHAAQTKIAEIYERLRHPLAHLKTYPRGGITTAKLLQIAARWVQRDATGRPGVDIIWIDHGGELDHTSDKVDEHRLRVGLSYKRLRDFAVDNGVPIVTLAHTRRRSDQDTEARPPRADEVRDSSDIENAARLMLGMWESPDERDHFRITSLKATEAERFVTWRLPRLKKCALIDPDGAEVVNLQAEKMAKAKARREEKEAERAAARAKREAEKAAAKNEKAKKTAQSTMFGGGE